MILYHVATVFIAVLVALLAFLNNQRGEMELETYTMAKLMLFVLPTTFPSNDTISVKRWRKLIAVGSLNAAPMPNISRTDVFISSDNDEPTELHIFNFNQTAGQPPRDVIVFFFAGAWVLGSVVENERMHKTMAEVTDFVVVGVEYSLAPEHPFPQGFNDAVNALHWISANIAAYGGNPSRIFVTGESAGGNIAAALVAYNLDTRYVKLDDRASVIGVMLVYPPVAANFSTDSYIKHARFNGKLTTAEMQWAWAMYAGGMEISPSDYRYQPLVAPDSLLAQFPTTEIIYAEYDVLRDDSVMFADKLRSLGVAVGTTYYANTIHGFFGRPFVSQVLGTPSLRNASQKLLSMSRSIPVL